MVIYSWALFRLPEQSFYLQVSVARIPSNLITYKFQNVPVWKNFQTLSVLHDFKSGNYGTRSVLTFEYMNLIFTQICLLTDYFTRTACPMTPKPYVFMSFRLAV